MLSRLPRTRLLPLFLLSFLLIYAASCSEDPSVEPEVVVKTEDLYRAKNQTYTYVKGDLEDCRNLSIHYLEGNVKGNKTFGLQIDVMRGNVIDGSARINVLHGDIIRGRGIIVNLLIGEDFSGEAKVLKRIDPALASENPAF